jgi:hypothetical protein
MHSHTPQIELAPTVVTLTVPESTTSRVVPNGSMLAALLRFVVEGDHAMPQGSGNGSFNGSFRVADILSPHGADDATAVAAAAAAPGASGGGGGGCASSVEMGVRCEAARALITSAAVEFV